jgi:small subunit ribosomal protein S17
MKTRIGTITALNTPKTAQVTVARQWQHPLYKKSVVRTKRYACHLEMDVQLGDQVYIQQCRPMSKTKRFRVVSLVTKQD